jgi:hypothetical protein
LRLVRVLRHRLRAAMCIDDEQVHGVRSDVQHPESHTANLTRHLLSTRAPA